MAGKRGKGYRDALERVDRNHHYEPAEAVALLKKTARASFDETVEVHIRLGVNVRHAREDFPEELRETATSLALAGADAALEDVAAEVLNAFEPLWSELQEGDRAKVLNAWSERAAFWGEPVTVRTPAGPVSGVAQRLDADGGLVLRLESGAETTVIAGDLEPGAAPEGCAR